MQLLSWMHRKFQKDATGSLQTLVVGSTCTCLLLKPSANNHGEYKTPSNDSIQRWQSRQQCQHHLKEFNDENTEEFSENQSPDIFPGFLTIGTLSVESISEAPTPTFDLPHQLANESGMAEMRYDLKLINEELEKFLKVEAEKEGNTDLSRKNSEASTITLSEEVKEDENDYNSVKMYPLQGYLFGSSNELLETKPKEKKEKVSLFELFKKNTIMARNSIKEADKTQKQAAKEIKSSDHLINKMLHPAQISHKISNCFSGHAAESFPTTRKLNKINQLFHKKVHPENSKAAYAVKDPKVSKYKYKHKTPNSSNTRVDSELGSERSKIRCWGALKRGKKHCSKTDMKLPCDAITGNYLDLPQRYTNGESGDADKEHWINTDEEYFVLELQQNEEVQD
ncbi:protein LAZY 1-like isoform X2 [Chenopodium quinoa]|uniref:protein LAZY 1-like isoform X2 n=1 Tax=Chenopodium quinoa TaxID=63459 RepID=UPI000B7723FC|nr:protein LAZY 1-like isoform X2 [Chenopodium quinoa]